MFSFLAAGSRVVRMRSGRSNAMLARPRAASYSSSSMLANDSTLATPSFAASLPCAIITSTNGSMVLMERMVSSAWQGMEHGIWLMSSTLKKRRSKMNKHKLRKRRKKERLKSK